MKRDPYLENRVLSADPIELIQMIHQHGLDMVREARRFLASGNIAGRSEAICRALAALAELDGSLNHSQGGEISRNFARLYQYMRMRLTSANVNQDDAPLAEVESLWKTLAEAWGSLRTNRTSDPAAPTTAENAPVAPTFGGRFVTETQFEHAGHTWNA